MPIQRAPFAAAFLRQFQSTHYIQNLLRSNRDRRFLENRISQVGIEDSIISRHSCNRVGSHRIPLGRVESAPFLLCFYTPGVVAWYFATLEQLLLWIDPLLNKHSFLTTNNLSE